MASWLSYKRMQKSSSKDVAILQECLANGKQLAFHRCWYLIGALNSFIAICFSKRIFHRGSVHIMSTTNCQGWKWAGFIWGPAPIMRRIWQQDCQVQGRFELPCPTRSMNSLYTHEGDQVRPLHKLLIYDHCLVGLTWVPYHPRP